MFCAYTAMIYFKNAPEFRVNMNTLLPGILKSINYPFALNMVLIGLGYSLDPTRRMEKWAWVGVGSLGRSLSWAAWSLEEVWSESQC